MPGRTWLFSMGAPDSFMGALGVSRWRSAAHVFLRNGPGRRRSCSNIELFFTCVGDLKSPHNRAGILFFPAIMMMRGKMEKIEREGNWGYGARCATDANANDLCVYRLR